MYNNFFIKHPEQEAGRINLNLVSAYGAKGHPLMDPPAIWFSLSGDTQGALWIFSSVEKRDEFLKKLDELLINNF